MSTSHGSSSRTSIRRTALGRTCPSRDRGAEHGRVRRHFARAALSRSVRGGRQGQEAGGAVPSLCGPTPYTSPTRYAATVDTIQRRYSPGLWALMRPVFGGDTIGWRARDPAVYARQLVARRAQVPALFVDIGRDDPFLSRTAPFRRHHRARYPGEIRQWPGKHDWVYWRLHAVESLTWMAGVIEQNRSQGPGVRGFQGDGSQERTAMHRLQRTQPHP